MPLVRQGAVNPLTERRLTGNYPFTGSQSGVVGQSRQALHRRAQDSLVTKSEWPDREWMKPQPSVKNGKPTDGRGGQARRGGGEPGVKQRQENRTPRGRKDPIENRVTRWSEGRRQGKKGVAARDSRETGKKEKNQQRDPKQPIGKANVKEPASGLSHDRIYRQMYSWRHISEQEGSRDESP